MGLLLRNPPPQTSLQPPVLILLTMDIMTRWSICPVTSDFTTFWVVFHALCSQVQIVHIMRSVLINAASSTSLTEVSNGLISFKIYPASVNDLWVAQVSCRKVTSPVGIVGFSKTPWKELKSSSSWIGQDPMLTNLFPPFMQSFEFSTLYTKDNL